MKITQMSRWFRVYGEMIDDLKIAKLTDKAFRVFMEILCLQCLDGHESGNTGMTIEQYKWRSRRKNPSLEMDKLASLKIIDVDADGFIIVPKWNKRQYKSDNETSTDRVKKYRSVNRLDVGKRNNDETFQCNADETLMKRPCNALDQNRTEQNRVIPPNPPPAGGTQKRKSKRLGKKCERCDYAHRADLRICDDGRTLCRDCTRNGIPPVGERKPQYSPSLEHAKC